MLLSVYGYLPTFQVKLSVPSATAKQSKKILLGLFDPDVSIICLDELGRQKGLSYGTSSPKIGVMLPVSSQLVTSQEVAGSDHYRTTLLILKWSCSVTPYKYGVIL